MIEDCIHLGTIPFSILARHGFIARILLLSLVQRGVLSMDHVNQIQAGVRTVASDLVSDMERWQLGELDRDTFMKQYGYLRPGTYDIMSPRYDQMSDLGESDFEFRQKLETPKYEFTLSQRKLIDQLLHSEGFTGIDCEYFLNYFERATVGREYGKFIFTHSVSNILEMIARFGEYHGLSRDELSHLTITDLLKVVTSSSEGSLEDYLRGIAETNAKHHSISAAIRLPQILFDEAGIHIIPFQVNFPNFITNKKITANCITLGSNQTSHHLSRMIVLIENADPGFDWIFSQQISGLITKYGGANSHMAIRCAEFGIPAAIGCGEQRFDVLLKSNQIMLDCSASLIKTLY
jgi:phosphohistidine swiveling domain-containing protein